MGQESREISVGTRAALVKTKETSRLRCGPNPNVQSRDLINLYAEAAERVGIAAEAAERAGLAAEAAERIGVAAEATERMGLAAE